MNEPDDRPDDLPGDRPPRRLLDRAPSERLAARAASTAGGGGAGSATDASEASRVGVRGGTGSMAAAVGLGLVAAVGGAVVHLVFATLLLWTSGLVLVAATIGIVVGVGVAVGGGTAVARRWLAVGLAVGAVVVAVGVNWALSGMYLGPLDYLAQVYGLLVPAQLLLAVAGALAGAR